MRIFVGNFAFTTTKDELRQLFEAYGEVEQVRIITDPETGRSRGFGFVEMPDTTEAQAAMAGINRRGLAGRTLSVKEARERGAPHPHDERRPRW
jgi:RNA recognition motif-containing protein